MPAPLTAWIERQWWQTPPSVFASSMRPLSALYGAIVTMRRAAINPVSLSVPVVVVGNLVVGGAGKTPTTIALVQSLQARGWRPGVVSRGHGRTAASRRSHPVLEVLQQTSALASGDEPLLIQRRTGVPTFVGVNRVAVAQQLLQQHPSVNVLVSDDGLQHHRLARATQCIVFDERGLGNGHLLPAGPLREPFRRTLPNHSHVLYNADHASTPWPGMMVQRGVSTAIRLDAWWRGHLPTSQALSALRTKPVLAAAGVAAPQRFFAMLEAQGLMVAPCPLPDHFDWANAVTDAVPLAPDQNLVITEKDAIKLSQDHPWGDRTWVVPLDFVLPPTLVDALERDLRAWSGKALDAKRPS
jgi:tetraacyldisaccharide 4'-kinase